MKIKFSVSSINVVRKFGLTLWIRHYKLFFLLSFLALSGFAAFQWHRDLYRYRWSDEERKSFLETTSKETNFKEKQFLEAIERLEQQERAFAAERERERDIFAGARKEKP